MDNLLELSAEQPLFVTFLRHRGCTFCRQWVSAIARNEAAIRAKGLKLVFVHLSSEGDGRKFIESYGLKDFVAVSDPNGKIYAEIGAKRARAFDLLRPSVIKSAIKQGIFEGHGLGRPDGDPWQLGGFAILRDRKILASRLAQTLDASPDFFSLLSNDDLPPGRAVR